MDNNDNDDFDFFDEMFDGLEPSEEMNDDNAEDVILEYLDFVEEHMNFVVGIEEINNDHLKKITFFLKIPGNLKDKDSDDDGGGDDGDGGEPKTPKVPNLPVTFEIEA